MARPGKPGEPVVRDTPRASDVLTLEMIARRRAGRSLSQIGRALGVAPGAVALRTNAVLAADLEHPDPLHSPAAIRGAYW